MEVLFVDHLSNWRQALALAQAQQPVQVKKERPEVDGREVAGDEACCSRVGPGPSSEKDMTAKDAMECTICLDFAPSPIFNCDNGHITCGVCEPKLQVKRCSMCKAGLSRTPFGERLAKKLGVTLNCENEEEGCRSQIKSTELKQHFKVCPYRPIRCSVSFCEGGTFSLSRYPEHMRRRHGVQSVDGPEFNSLLRVLEMEPGCKRNIPEKLICWDEKVFVRKGYQTRQFLYMWMEILGGKEEAVNYKYTVTAESINPHLEEASMVFNLPVFPVHGPVPTATRARFANFSVHILKSYEYEDEANDAKGCFFKEVLTKKS